jgi:hypothetical protein
LVGVECLTGIADFEDWQYFKHVFEVVHGPLKTIQLCEVADPAVFPISLCHNHWFKLNSVNIIISSSSRAFNCTFIRNFPNLFQGVAKYLGLSTPKLQFKEIGL